MRALRHLSRAQIQTYATYFLTHQILSFQAVRNHVRQRTVVADRSSENKAHAFSNATVKYSTLNDPLFDRLPDSAGFSARVDRPEMMFMAFAGADFFV